MKNILVIGAKGNMGQRYCRILELFDQRYFEFDIDHDIRDLRQWARISDGCIIASPTDTHCEMISKIYYFNHDIKFLVEKPLSKDISEVEKLLSPSLFPNMHVTLINQYKYMFKDDDEGRTYYNFFKTGNDGLAWDCVSIIGLARGDIEIRNDSPIWDCMINGSTLDLGKVDMSYVKMLKAWLKKPDSNHDYIIESHKKVLKLKGKIDANCINCNTSKVG